MRTLFRRTKHIAFEASHQVEGLPPKHKEGRLHGHSYKADIGLAAQRLDEAGLILEDNVLNAVQDVLDRIHLNDLMTGTNPTTENLARLIHELVGRQLQAVDAIEDVRVEFVHVFVGDGTDAELRFEGELFPP